MKLSFSTNAFSRFSVFRAVECIGSLGYDGVELLADAPHLYADSVSEGDLTRLRAILGQTGLSVANINANTAVGYYGRSFWEPLFEPSLANPDLEARRWRIEYTKRCIEMAHALGAQCVSVTSGRPVPGILPRESLSLLRQSVVELLIHAEERSIAIGIEYEPGLLIERSEELASFIEEIGSPLLGANLDLGHSHVAGEDPQRVIEILGHRIWHLHVEDILDRKHYHLVPGTGEMDFARLFDLVASTGYKGFATVELYTFPDRPEQVARQAYEFLRGL
jgi:sugar phosphate isomerase/epimerase